MRQPRIMQLEMQFVTNIFPGGKCIQEVSVLTHVHMRI